jgi:hypothetical protein
MNLDVKKPCYFCGGKYEKVTMPKGMEDYTISTAVINKVGTDKILMSKSIAFRCKRWVIFKHSWKENFRFD